ILVIYYFHHQYRKPMLTLLGLISHFLRNSPLMGLNSGFSTGFSAFFGAVIQINRVASDMTRGIICLPMK
ncbi:MAG: hypothetical protein J5623_02275, partial [Clostridiales bacterium]|nr:hypothetical protein [Clostridiales bacterium]